MYSFVVYNFHDLVIVIFKKTTQFVPRKVNGLTVFQMMMDKIWDNPSKSEVIGRCGGDEKNERPRRPDKSRTLKNKTKNNHCVSKNSFIEIFV